MSLTVWHHLTTKQPHHNHATLAILRNKLNDPSHSGWMGLVRVTDAEVSLMRTFT